MGQKSTTFDPKGTTSWCNLLQNTVFHFKKRRGFCGGLWTTRRSDGVAPCSAPRRGFFVPRGTATTQDLVYKLTWVKTGGSRDDDKFFRTKTIFTNTSTVPTGWLGGLS